jgi:predicted nuclease with RNAse H fold
VDGFAVLDVADRLVASTSVVYDEEIASFAATDVRGPAVVAIDAPLVVPNVVVPNAIGQRQSEVPSCSEVRGLRARARALPSRQPPGRLAALRERGCSRAVRWVGVAVQG